MKPSTIELGELVAAMSKDVVRIQQLWDSDYGDAVANFAAMVAHADPESAQLLRSLAPSRMVASSFELSFQAMITAELQESFSIRALPLNLEFSLRHSARTERYSRIGIFVEQVPLTTSTQQA